MTFSYGILGQSFPSASAASVAYAAAASVQAIVSTVVACNTDASQTTFRVAARPDAESLTNKHYLVYDATLGANTTAAFTLGITLNGANAELIEVSSDSGSVAFNVFGSEVL